ncbi:FTR1 family iron permease [Allocoleopsis franciscana]|uniref:High-affinity Fe2+/Pb2+ permease n=1 Tax=Allocoleopsis franciscana PCC 7113 TaxID=1173027 RepID=K9W9I2_9CYAN|nr:FTR1 family protein [Allocoleopsis franciscana]AFZ16903.1 high-affinity Fe2+/Pb2+ permease [Allocoleopsis franciscana PCC 7113]
MDFTAALPTFVITLREGVEAAIVVGIVLACLKKAKAGHLNPWVYAGVAVGLVASALVGVLFSWGIQALSATYPQYAPVIEPLLEAVFGVIAIAMLSWMLIWMTQQAKYLKSEVEGAVTSAIQQGKGSGWGVFTLILIAVLREGFETVLFIVAKFQQGLIPALGAIAGIAVAAGIGVLLFKWGIKINIRLFFQVMGVLLLLIVAGLVVSSLSHFDESIKTLAQMDRKSADLCFYYERFAKDHSCILGPIVWNMSSVLPDDQFPGIVLKALIGYREKIYLVQSVAYLLFMFTIGGLYFNSLAVPAGASVQHEKSASRK